LTWAFFVSLALVADPSCIPSCGCAGSGACAIPVDAGHPSSGSGRGSGRWATPAECAGLPAQFQHRAGNDAGCGPAGHRARSSRYVSHLLCSSRSTIGVAITSPGRGGRCGVTQSVRSPFLSPRCQSLPACVLAHARCARMLLGCRAPAVAHPVAGMPEWVCGRDRVWRPQRWYPARI